MVALEQGQGLRREAAQVAVAGRRLHPAARTAATEARGMARERGDAACSAHRLRRTSGAMSRPHCRRACGPRWLVPGYASMWGLGPETSSTTGAPNCLERPSSSSGGSP
eukprot:6918362-Prymnesium_polylepis.1